MMELSYDTGRIGPEAFWVFHATKEAEFLAETLPARLRVLSAIEVAQDDDVFATAQLMAANEGKPYLYAGWFPDKARRHVFRYIKERLPKLSAQELDWYYASLLEPVYAMVA